MGNNDLTVSQTLKFSRHDHMNELQLLLMYIDLGKPEQAKHYILERTAVLQQQAALQRLSMPETEQWLQTLNWRHPLFAADIQCRIETAVQGRGDEAAVQFLEQLALAVEKTAERYSDCPAAIDVTANAAQWTIRLTFSNLAAQPDIPEHSSQLTVGVQYEPGRLTVTVSGQLGG